MKSNKGIILFDTETLDAEAFIVAYEKLVEQVKKSQDLTADTVDKMSEFVSKSIAKMEKRSASDLSEIKDKCEALTQTLSAKLSKEVMETKNAIQELSERVDAIPGAIDKKALIEEVIANLPKEEKTNEPEETPDDVIDTINKGTKKIVKERVEGLDDALRIAAHNAVAVSPTTTVFFKNGQQVGRAKNINIQSSGSAISITGDTANINLTAGASGVSTIVAGTNISVDSTDPQNPIVSATAGTGITRQVSVISTPTTAGATAATDYVYLVSGTTTLTLPTAVGNTNLYTVKNAGVATVTIATTSAQTIDGSASASLPVANTSLDLISDGANWVVV